MGIVNVTPDSFSDGGIYDTSATAIDHAYQLVEDGASIIDIGGESTRPTSQRISAAEEIQRIGEVVKELAHQDFLLSVDTIHSETAEYAIKAGADIINDVSGGLYDPRMVQVIARSDVAYVVQHWRGTPDVMDQLTDYSHDGGVVEGVIVELSQRMEQLLDSGVDELQIIIDPGIGFAKTSWQSWQLIRNSHHIGEKLGRPVLVGHSRKRFLAEACAPNQWHSQRDNATAALSALLTQKNIWAIRVHDVQSNVTALRSALCWNGRQM